MRKDFKTKGYVTPCVEICSVESTMLCATSTSTFNDGGSLPGWDAINTTPFNDGGTLPNFN